MTPAELERIKAIEDKLNAILDHFHIGKAPANLDDIERQADRKIRSLNRKRNSHA